MLSPTPVFHLVAPTLVAVDLGITEPSLETHLDTSPAFEAGAPKPSSSPTFLLVSVFRL